MEQEQDIKKEVTRRWVEAVDHLIQTDRVKSYRRIGEVLGIDYQRISIFKSFVDTGKRVSYVGTDYILLLHQKYNVSLDFLLKGEGPILVDGDPNEVTHEEANIPSKLKKMAMTVDHHDDQISILSSKVDILEREIDILKRQ